jgi:hypothetical protein
MGKIDFDQYNQEVREWATRMRSTIQTTGAGMGIRHRSNSPSAVPSLPRLRTGFKNQAGAIEVISFQFPRSLIWTHYGAGKGMAGTAGSSWVDRHGNPKKTNGRSTGKMGTGSRSPKPWLSRPLSASTGVDALADIAAKGIGATVADHILK